MVRARPRTRVVLLCSFRPQWAQVTVAPEVSRSSVLMAGMPQGPMALNSPPSSFGPADGHTASNWLHSRSWVSAR